jgi:hypothetical protein
MKLVGLIKLYFNETFTNVSMGKHLRGALPIWEGLKQCNELSPHLINAALKDIRKIRGKY